MIPLSQNKKIALSAVGVFIVSFIAMAFFLKNNMGDGHMSANILHASGDKQGGHGEEVEVVVEPDESLYLPYMEGGEDPFLVTDAEGRVKFVSDGFCDLIVRGCEKMKEGYFFDYFNTNDLPEFVSEYTHLIHVKENVEGMGPFRMMKNDEEMLVLLNAYLMQDGEEGKIEGIIFSMKDLTEQINELNDAEKVLPTLEEVVEEEEPSEENWDGLKLVDKISYKSD